EFVERIQTYMTKAIKEAKVNTSWINPDEEYERAIAEFIAAILEPEGEFVRDLSKFRAPVARAGLYNALSQTLLKIAAPGVPDFYQGTELWDFSLVDPDNRRPIDYAHRKSLMAVIRRESEADPAAWCDRMIEAPENG